MKAKPIKSTTRTITAIATGVVTSLACLVLWMLVSLRFHCTWVPVVTALIIATLIRVVMKSGNPLVGIFSALLSLAVAITGNLFSMMVLISKYSDRPLYEIISGINSHFLYSVLRTYTRPIDILMYIGVLFAGFWFSFLKKVSSCSV